MGFAILVVLVNGGILYAVWAASPSLQRHISFPALACAFFTCAAAIKAQEQGLLPGRDFLERLAARQIPLLIGTLALEVLVDYAVSGLFRSGGYAMLLPIMLLLWIVMEVSERLDDRRAFLLAAASFGLTTLSGGLYLAALKDGKGTLVQGLALFTTLRANSWRAGALLRAR